MQIPVRKFPSRPDLETWLEKRQSELKITDSITTSSGQILDWVPIESQSDKPIATPPPAEPRDQAIVRPEHPVAAARLAEIPDGPAGHVPILRPDLTRVPEGLTVEQFLSKRGSPKPAGHGKAADPSPAGYFHATSAANVTAYGCDAWLNVWDPKVQTISGAQYTDHSISQTWLQNRTATLQSLEAGLSVDDGLNGDFSNHIFTYFTTNDYASNGDNVGGYNRAQKGWVQYHPTIFPGIRVNGASTQGGTQLEIAIKYQLWEGNWWFGVNNNETGPWIWIGYYPASLFKDLAKSGTWVSFGGEVYSGLSNPCQTTDQMGSGRHANTGWTHAAYQRLLHTQSNTGGTTVNFNGTAEVDTAAAKCPAGLYTVATFMNSGGSWGSYQYYGGTSN